MGAADAVPVPIKATSPTLARTSALNPTITTRRHGLMTTYPQSSFLVVFAPSGRCQRVGEQTVFAACWLRGSIGGGVRRVVKSLDQSRDARLAARLTGDLDRNARGPAVIGHYCVGSVRNLSLRAVRVWHSHVARGFESALVLMPLHRLGTGAAMWDRRAHSCRTSRHVLRLVGSGAPVPYVGVGAVVYRSVLPAKPRWHAFTGGTAVAHCHRDVDDLTAGVGRMVGGGLGRELLIGARGRNRGGCGRRKRRFRRTRRWWRRCGRRGAGWRGHSWPHGCTWLRGISPSGRRPPIRGAGCGRRVALGTNRRE